MKEMIPLIFGQTTPDLQPLSAPAFVYALPCTTAYWMLTSTYRSELPTGDQTLQRLFVVMCLGVVRGVVECIQGQTNATVEEKRQAMQLIKVIVETLNPTCSHALLINALLT